VERVKPIQRNASAASAAEQEAYRPELITDEEPRYLRRQKPVEIRRKKFGNKSWSFYRRLFVWTLGAAALATAGGLVIRFALHSPQMALLMRDQIEVRGNRVVPQEEVQKLFVRDRGRSVLQVPLEARRSQIEQLAWVEQASVQRILPNHLRVELTERTPVAFFRNGSELTLIDGEGVLLDRPEGEDFHFPIVTGLSENMRREERAKRMQTYQEFMKDINLVKPGSAEDVSELDLGDPRNLRAVLTGLASGTRAQAVTVEFGAGDFINKYKMLVQKFPQWQADNGPLRRIDLRYSRQVVVNPDTSASAVKPK
jgi:cell division protein FtsQ